MHCRSFSKVEFLDIIGTKSLKSFPPCYSQSTLITDPPPPLPSKNGLKLVCNVNIVYGNLKSENSKDYAQKPRRNFTFMNSASVLVLFLCTFSNSGSHPLTSFD